MIILNSEATLKGVKDEAVIEIFDSEICSDDFYRVLRTKIGAIIELFIGLEEGVQLQSKLYLCIECNHSSAPSATLCHEVLPFLDSSISNIQSSTHWDLSWPIRHIDKLLCLYLPGVVLLIDSNIACSLVYHVALAFHHFNHILWDVLEVY